MSRALGVVAKLAFFLVVVVVGVFLFSKDSRRALSDRWAMRQCPQMLEADLQLPLAWAHPKVDHCEGTPARATCLLTTTDRSGRNKKTAPIKDWDCTKRQINDTFYIDMMRAMQPQKGESYQGNAGEMMARAEKVQQEFIQQVRYVSDRLRARQEALGEPEQGPFPGFPGFPTP